MAFPKTTLGKDGPIVETVGTGLMSIGHAYGHAGDDDARLKYLDELYDTGARHWDTADIYQDCEELVGKWFALNPDKRKDIFLATKFALDFSTGVPKIRSDAEYVKEAFQRSSKKLQTDYFDLYYCHRVDGVTPIEKTIGAMVELKTQGKIKYLGLSEVSSRTIQRAQAIHPIAALQIEYSPFALEIEKAKGKDTKSVLQTCQDLGIAVVAYSPLGRGLLTGTIKSAKDVEGDARSMFPGFKEDVFEHNYQLVEKIQAITETKKKAMGDSSLTQSQVVLAWIRRQGNMIIPLPGTRNVDRLKENLASMTVELTNEEEQSIRDACEAVKRIGDRYPQVMEFMQDGDTPEL